VIGSSGYLRYWVTHPNSEDVVHVWNFRGLIPRRCLHDHYGRWSTASFHVVQRFYCWGIKPMPWSGGSFWNISLVYKFVISCIYSLVCNGIRFIPSQTNVRLGFCDTYGMPWCSSNTRYSGTVKLNNYCTVYYCSLIYEPCLHKHARFFVSTATEPLCFSLFPIRLSINICWITR